MRWFFHATLDPYKESIPYCADIKCKKVFGIEVSEKMSVYVFIPGSLGMSCGKIFIKTYKQQSEQIVSGKHKNLENYTPDENAKVSVWYGAKEPNMKKAVAAIRKVYPKAEDHPFPGIGHGEILSFPEEMVREIKKFVEDENA